MCIFHIRPFLILISYRIAQPKFIPPNLIHTVIMTTTSRISRFIEIRIKQNCICRFLTTGRTTVNTYPVHIHIRIFPCSRLNPSNMVRQTGIFQILITYILKSTRTERSSHSIDHYDDKTKFGQGSHIPVIRTESLRNILVSGTLINVFDNRIFLVRVKVGGAGNQSPHIRLAVPPFGNKHLRSFPAFGLQKSYIGCFQRHHHFAIPGTT